MFRLGVGIPWRRMAGGVPSWVPAASGVSADFAVNFALNQAWINGTSYMSMSQLAVTRASAAYAVDVAGTWALFASSAAARTDAGLSVYEGRTNGIRNNSMQGAVAGTPGTRPTNWVASLAGLTQTIVGVGTQNGVDYVDIRLNGTTSGTSISLQFDSTTGIAASNAQTWAGSAFVAMVAGSAANLTLFRLRTDCRDGAGAFLTSLTNATFTPTGTLTRVAGAVTTNSASTAYVMPYLALTCTTASAVDITLRIGWPQMELGAFATTPIRTTSTAVTRNADAISLALPAALQGQTAYTLVCEWQEPVTAKQRFPVAINGATIAERLAFSLNASNVLDAQSISSSSDSMGTVDTPTVTAQAYKAGIAVGAGAGAFAYNGVLSTDASITVPSGLATLHFGSGAGAADFLNSTIKTVALWKSRVSNSDLTALAT